MNHAQSVVFESRPYRLCVRLPEGSSDATEQTVQLALEALMPGVAVSAAMSGTNRWLDLRSGKYKGSSAWRQLTAVQLNSRLQQLRSVKEVTTDDPDRVTLVLSYKATDNHLARLGKYLEEMRGAEVKSAIPGGRRQGKQTMVLIVPGLEFSEFKPKLIQRMRFLVESR